MTRALLILLLLAQEPGVPEAVKKGQAKLNTSPDDADANLTVGRYMAFDLGAWDTGIPLLAKGSDATLKSLAEKDLGAGKDPLAMMDRGDDWIAGASKRPAHRAACQERAGHWYKQAWLAAQGPAKDKLRERFRKFAAAPPGYEKPGSIAGTLSGWDAPNDYWEVHLESALAHSGRQSMKILPVGKDNATGVSGFNSQAIPAIAGRKYVATAWVFTDRTDADATFRMRFVDQAGTVLSDQFATVPQDSPFWQKVLIEATAPEKAFRITVNFGAQIKQGGIWVDDVSLKLEGKELLKNPGFEEK